MQKRDKFRLQPIISRNGSPLHQIFGCMRGTVTILGDIVSPDPELWDCELGIAYQDEDGIAFGYDDKKINMEEAIKNAR